MLCVCGNTILEYYMLNKFPLEIGNCNPTPKFLWFGKHIGTDFIVAMLLIDIYMIILIACRTYLEYLHTFNYISLVDCFFVQVVIYICMFILNNLYILVYTYNVILLSYVNIIVRTAFLIFHMIIVVSIILITINYIVNGMTLICTCNFTMPHDTN